MDLGFRNLGCRVLMDSGIEGFPFRFLSQQCLMTEVIRSRLENLSTSSMNGLLGLYCLME